MAVEFVVRALAQIDLGRDSELDTHNTDWFTVLQESGNRLVTPSIFLSLRSLDIWSELPGEVRSALTLLYEANVERNAKLTNAWQAVRQVLNNNGICCIPLKGMAMLERGLYPDNDRVLADVDFLIHEDDVCNAVRALSKAGYLQIENVHDSTSLDADPKFLTLDPVDFRNRAHAVGYQLPALLSPQDNVVLELHYRLAEGNSKLAIYLNNSAEILLSNNDNTQLEETMALLSDEVLVAHNYYHAHIKDAGHSSGSLDLRHTLDVRRMAEGGIKVNEIFAKLRKTLEGTSELQSLASYVSCNASLWPGYIDHWELLSVTEKRGVDYYNRVAGKPQLSRFIRLAFKLRRKAQYLFSTDWLKSMYGDIGLPSILFCLSRNTAIRIFKLVMPSK